MFACWNILQFCGKYHNYYKDLYCTYYNMLYCTPHITRYTNTLETLLFIEKFMLPVKRQFTSQLVFGEHFTAQLWQSLVFLGYQSFTLLSNTYNSTGYSSHCLSQGCKSIIGCTAHHLHHVDLVYFSIFHLWHKQSE